MGERLYITFSSRVARQRNLSSCAFPSKNEDVTEISYIAEFYFSVFSSTTRSTFLAEKCTHIAFFFVAHSLYVVCGVKGAIGDFRHCACDRRDICATEV